MADTLSAAMFKLKTKHLMQLQSVAEAAVRSHFAVMMVSDQDCARVPFSALLQTLAAGKEK